MQITKTILIVAAGVCLLRSLSDADDGKIHSQQLDIRGSRVVFSPTSRTLAVAPLDRDGAITFVDVDTGKSWQSATTRSSFTTGGPAKIAFSSDGKLLASANGSSSKGGLSVWHVGDGALCEGFDNAGRALDSFALGIAFAPDNRTILTGGDGTYIWRLGDAGTLESGPQWLPIDSQAKRPLVSSLAFSPDGLSMAAGDWEGKLVLFASTGKSVAGVPLAIPQGNLYDVCFSSDSKMLGVLTGVEARDATVRLPAGRPARSAPKPATPASSAVTIWKTPPREVRASRSAKATKAAALFANIVDRADFGIEQFTPVAGGITEAVTYSAYGVIGVGGDQRVEDGVVRRTSKETVNQFVGRAKRSITFFGDPPPNWQRKKPEMLLETHFSKVVSKPTITLSLDSLTTCFAISHDGATVATGGEDKIIRLWDLRSKRVRQTLEGHSGAIQSLAFSKDGHILAAAGGEVKLWYLKGEPKLALLPKAEPDEPERPTRETRKMLRTWSDVTGKVKVEASFVSNRKGKLTLKKQDGTTVTMSLAKLSPADKDFLARTRPKARKKKQKKS